MCYTRTLCLVQFQLVRRLVKIPVNLKRNLHQNSYPGISGQQFLKISQFEFFIRFYLIQMKTAFLRAARNPDFFLMTDGSV